MKTCKSLKILADDHIPPEGLTMEEWQVIRSEELQKVLYQEQKPWKSCDAKRTM